MTYTFKQSHRNRKSWTYMVEQDGAYVAMLHDNDNGTVSVRDVRTDLPRATAQEIARQFRARRAAA